MNTRIIIPAAGFGKRVGSPPAKELFPHPKTGNPLIEEALKKARSVGTPLVITRPDKTELIEYLKATNTQYHLIGATREWPITVLASEPFWLEKNVLLLPDTDFNSASQIINELIQGLEKNSVTLGVFPVQDSSVWGMIKNDERKLMIADKPRMGFSSMQAWGLIGFNKAAGNKLFTAIAESNVDGSWKKTDLDYSTYKLSGFADLAR